MLKKFGAVAVGVFKSDFVFYKNINLNNRNSVLVVERSKPKFLLIVLQI